MNSSIYRKPRSTAKETIRGTPRSLPLLACMGITSFSLRRRQLAKEFRYLVSKLLNPLLGCDTSSLRALNAGTLCLICPLSYGILRILRGHNIPGRQESDDEKTYEEKAAASDPTTVLDAHSALNIALFPPLIFFSALYYTDVMSTLVVLLSYSVFLKKSSATGSAVENIMAICVGIVALFFRQTNIFWVAVFPAGLAVVNAFKRDESPPVSSTSADVTAVLRKCWSEGKVYDCSIQDAGPQGMLGPKRRGMSFD